jgi:hypothetical protein
MSVVTRIVVDKDGTRKTTDVAGWKAFTLTERIDLMNTNNVHFFDNATELTPREALAAMKALGATAG